MHQARERRLLETAARLFEPLSSPVDKALIVLLAISIARVVTTPTTREIDVKHDLVEKIAVTKESLVECDQGW